MTDSVPNTFATITADIVSAYLAHNHIRPGEVAALLHSVHDTLSGLGKALDPEAAPEKPTPPVSIRKSVTNAYLISMEDGKQYQSLKRHLTKHGLTPAEYRAKWGLPYDYPMVSPAYARQRSEMAKSIGLGGLRKKG